MSKCTQIVSKIFKSSEFYILKSFVYLFIFSIYSFPYEFFFFEILKKWFSKGLAVSIAAKCHFGE